MRGPLQLLRADYRTVPFQPRDELTVLRHWCHQAVSQQQLELAIIDGVGGSGKTRLALELAHRLQDQGWYAGLLLHSVKDSSWSQSVEWLASVVSPTLVIVDYADARVEDTKALLRALTARSGPAVVVLTARTVEGEWLTDIQGFLQRDGQILTQRRFDLPPEHPDSLAIFRRAIAAFTPGSPGAPPANDAGADAARAAPERWTTLDYVLLAWLAARGGGDVPATRQDLYEAVLEHEERYWADVYRDLTGAKGSPRVLRRAAACLTLLTPIPEQTAEALRAVTELTSADEWRENLRRTFAECFHAGPRETLALRPDPVADHLMVDVLGSDADLLDHCLASMDDEQLPYALANLNRASSTSPETVTTLFADWLRSYPDRWPAVLIVAAAQAGSALAALEALAGEEQPILPLTELAQAIPFGHIGLTRLGLAVDTRRLQQLRTHSMPEPEALAELLDRVSGRQSDAGDRGGALASSTEAVQIRRALAQASPAAYLPDLAGSLNNLSNRQSETGDRDGALASITEAVQIRRPLAQASPAAYLPDLAMALNNLSVQQSETGDRDGALASITEAVQHYRALAQASPAAYLPDLATSLNNLSNRQSETGDRDGALASSTEAVQHYRALAQASPAAYLPDLAMALNNLSVRQSETGDRDGALASITEAVQHYRDLAQASPAAYLPNLATSLNNLSVRQSETGDRDGALASITEAVQHYRDLAEASPAAYLPGLASSLNNLSNRQSETGDRDGALASITEAVQHTARPGPGQPRRLPARPRQRAEQPVQPAKRCRGPRRRAGLDHRSGPDPAGPGPGQPRRLPARSRRLAEQPVQPAKRDRGPRRRAGLDHRSGPASGSALAQASPAAYLPDLASSLNNLSVQQSETGDRDGALASITEAVQIRRALAQASPAAYLPDLASSLNNLSVRQSETGDRDGALASITEAVQIRRALAQASPAAYLPDLAGSLNNLSVQQSETGDRDGALASSTEAVQIRRALAQASPAAYLPDLASSLNNLSNQQSETGDRDGALASITEAVQHTGDLAKASPAAYLPDLARSLNNLSVQQSETGDRDGALASITEAVQIRRALAQASPAAYLPDLAGSLNNLSIQQSETGDRDGALASITEAVQIRRDLAQASPAAYLPDLAMALNNLSNRQSETGDRDGALASSTEAVQHYRDLAKASPAAYLPNLAISLNNLSHALEHSATDGGDPWVEAIAGFDDPLPQAELCAHYARALAADNNLDAAIEQLASAAAGADSGDPVPLGRARRAIRDAATTLGANDPQLPQWATSPIPDEHVDLINLWAAQRSWPAIDTFLNDHADIIQQNNFRASLALIADLYPDNPVPASLTALLAEIDRDGLNTVLAAGRARHHRTELIQAWIATPTWDQSASFLREHNTELTNTQTRDLLASYSDDDACRQHLAILYLADTMPLQEVYQMVTDTTVATEHALDLIESADLNQLPIILAAAPKAAEGITGAFIQTVIALATGNHDAARQLAELIAEHGNPSQREAFAIRLRAFASHQPNPAPALDVADLIAPETRQT